MRRNERLTNGEPNKWSLDIHVRCLRTPHQGDMKFEISVFLRWNVAKRLKIRNTRQNDSETVNCLANPIVPTVVEYNEMSSLCLSSL